MMEEYKKTKIGVLPNLWKIRKIKELTKVTSGATPSTNNNEYWGGDILWMSSGELNLKKIYDVNGRITDLGLKSTSTKMLPKNCVLIGLAGQGKTRGTAAINKIELCTNQSIAAIWPNSFTNENFLYYYLDSKYEELRKLSTGDGGRGGLNLNIIGSFQIPLPPIEEQKAIADCLSTWDEAIEKQEQLIKSKEYRHKALMQELLSGKKRLPGFSEDWKKYRYSELIKEVKRKEVWDDSNLYNLISVRRRSGGIFHRESLFGSQIEVKFLVKVKENDFLISKMQIVHGASSLVSKSFEDFYVSGSYIIINVKDHNVLSPKYLNLYSKQKTFYYQTYISSYGVHIEKMTFDFKTFLNMTATIPSVREQSSIIEIFEASDKEIELEKLKVDQLKEQKKVLMQKLLTGKVRLPYK